MAGFISKSACRGHRPAKLSSRHHVERPRLVGRLLKNRHVARFVCASKGFGKTGLLLEYAETIFGFEHVFWINGESPCFIRDLDADAMVSTVFAVDEHAKLVVFEDVPPLDGNRTQSFSKVIDAFLKNGCEVAVSCTPAADAYGHLQRDRIRLNAHDLLLSDDEAVLASKLIDAPLASGEPVPLARRISALAWEGEGAHQSFLEGLAHEELPADVQLALVSMLVLQRGLVGNLLGVGGFTRDTLDIIARDYAFAEFNEDDGSFEAVEFPPEVIGRIWRSKFSFLAASADTSEDQLALRWADMLIGDAASERACDVVSSMVSRAMRLEWAKRNFRTIVRHAGLLSASRLLEATREGRVLQPEAQVMLAWCAHLLDDEAEAVRDAKRAAFMTNLDVAWRLLALVILARCSDQTMCNRALGELQKVVDSPDVPATGEFSTIVAQGCLLTTRDVDGALAAWSLLAQHGADQDALCIVASWLFDLTLRHYEAGKLFEPTEQLGKVERFVQQRADVLQTAGSDLYVASAALAMERARVQGVPLHGKGLSTPMMMALRQVELRLFEQRRHWKHLRLDNERKRDNALATQPDSYLSVRDRQEAIFERLPPTLHIRLFGGLSVSIGDQPVNPSQFRRAKVRILLAWLAINPGREIPRITLQEMLWPGSRLDTSRKTLYSLWCQLSRALSLSDGTCPYLIRSQTGISLNASLTQVDMARFNQICRALLFDEVEETTFSELFTEIETHFCDRLLEGEKGSPVIDQVRIDCESRLMDVLVTASKRLYSAGNPMWALWYARMAMSRDATREDAALMLMRAQVATGQRTAAITTYLACRMALREEMGIDPSRVLSDFYQSILSEDDNEATCA